MLTRLHARTDHSLGLLCRDAFFTSTPEQNAALVRTQYRGCWKRMLLERPHIRFDGGWM